MWYNIKKTISRIFLGDPRYRTTTTRRVVERRVPRYETPRQVQQRTSREWAEESGSELDDASYVQRLEEEERYQRPRTPQLPVEPERIFREEQRPRNLIPDPWENYYYDDQTEKREG